MKKPHDRDRTQDQNCPEDERQLIHGLRSGDMNAFEQMVKLHGPRLLEVARRIVGDEDDAKDCLQDAFLAVHRSIAKFEGRSEIGTWLHRIVTNAALMKLRARRSRPEESIDQLQPAFDEFMFRIGPRRANDLAPDELLLRADTRRLVREAVASLSESHRIVLILRDFEGYSTRETSEMLGINVGAAKVRLHRARTALKELLLPLFEEDLC